jgi:drug/metabolite transporter (DMT)-like permease
MVPAAKQVSASHLSRAGVAWALLTVIIWGMWSVYSRLGLMRSLHPEDLVALRFGISGLLLLPLLFTISRGISRAVWIEGGLLAACQGAPFVFLLAAGLVFAPANHAPALTTGMMPLFAAILSFLLFGRRTNTTRSIGLALIICGAFTLAGVNSFAGSKVLFGDLLFVVASVMATIYALRADHLGLTATQGAGIVCVYSMVGYLPVYFFFADTHHLWEAPVQELLFQAIYQGVLMGTISMLTFNKAIGLLGAPAASAFVSLVPVVATLAAIPVLNEVPSFWDSLAVAAISCGVLAAAGVFSRQKG